MLFVFAFRALFETAIQLLFQLPACLSSQNTTVSEIARDCRVNVALVINSVLFVFAVYVTCATTRITKTERLLHSSALYSACYLLPWWC